jgi:hypothetical protein
MNRIELTGKHAVGDNRFALVDDRDFAWLNRWKWKAKPNGGGNNIYAVRNAYVDGNLVTIRMHREVLGLGLQRHGDLREVDHADHFGLNNQRANLRVATRSENLLNARRSCVAGVCPRCGSQFRRSVSATAARTVKYCSEKCAAEVNAAAMTARYVPHQSILLLRCEQCGAGMLGKKTSRRYCSDACRSRSKRTPVLNLSERVLAAIQSPQSSKSVSLASGAHESDARRVLAQLVNQGLAIVVSKPARAGRGRPPHLYQAITQ